MKLEERLKREPSIICVFDTNAHSYLADRSDVDVLISKLEGRSQPLIPHLTFVNFFEYLKMVKDERSLAQAQEYVRKLKRITLGGSILPLAKLHVQNAAGFAERKALEEDVKNLLRGMNLFLKLQSHEKFEKIILPHRRCDEQRIAEIVQGYEEMKEPNNLVLKEFRKQKKVSDFKRWLSLNAQKEYQLRFMERAIQRFGLSLSDFDNNLNALFDRLPSVRYFAAVYLHYVRQLTLNKRKAKYSDYFDLEQVAYLNVADYLVTGDDFFRDLINYCGDADLKGRAISLQGFISMIDGESLQRKAPDSSSRPWVELNSKKE